MKKILAFVIPLAASLALGTNPVLAAGTSFNITSGTTTSGQKLSSGQTGNVGSGGTLSVSGGTTAIATTSSAGTVTITNAGTIAQTGSDRAIRDNTGGMTLNITNSGTIKSSGSDTFQMNVAGDTVTLTNTGTISALGTGSNNGQALDWNALNSNSGSSTLHNNAGGIITAADADAVRAGQNSVITNDGKIQGSSIGDTGNDGIDAQNNTNVSITNANANLSANANLIEGASHGIAGGGPSANITMSVTNNSHGTIKGDDGSGINIDGNGAAEVVTVNNAGMIIGNGVTGDGDGVDVDGLVNLTNSGTIHSLNSINDASEGITVGGGTIVNSGTIQGSVVLSSNNTTGFGRGITLAGVDKDTNGNAVPIQKIYANTTITNNSGGLIKGDTNAGIAIVGVSGATNYTVTINNNAGATIEGAGTVAVIDGSAAVGAPLTVGGTTNVASANSTTINNYGTIQVDGSGKAISLGSGTNTVNILGASASINGDISGGTTAGSNALVIDPTSGNSFSYSHVLSNFASVEIKSGTVNFSGANIYAGTTTIDAAATLNLTGSGTIGTTSTLTIGSGSTFDLGGGSVTVVSLVNSGTINHGTVVTSGSASVSGLSGSTGLTQSSSGTTTVTGTNGYTGATSITNGKLDVSGTITTSTTTISGTGNLHLNSGTTAGVVLNSGGTLTGNGTVGALTVNSGGVLSPGNSPGVINAGNTVFNAGGSMILQLNSLGTTGAAGTNWDQLAVNGSLNLSSLSSTLTFALNLQTLDSSNVSNPLASFDPNVSMTWANVITTTGGITGFNANEFTFDTSLFKNTFNGTFSLVRDSNNANNLDLQYQVVPEPSTWALMLGGLAMLLFTTRRRLRRN